MRRRELEFKIARSEAKTICKKKRREFTNDLIARMQKFSEIQKKAYKELNIFWKGFKPISI